MSITLTVTDNGDGSGGVATIAGSTGGTTNTLYYTTWTGQTGSLAWTSAGSRTGNGNINVSLATGYYEWYIDNNNTGTHTISNIVYQNFSNTTDSIHYQSLVSFQTTIRSLNLSGITSSQIVVRMLPRVLENVDNLPNIIIAPLGKEIQVGELNGKDDVQYPIVVAIVDKQNFNYVNNLDKYTGWRQSIWRSFRHQHLAGLSASLTVDVDPDYVISPQHWNKSLFYSALLFRVKNREARGVGA